MGHRAREMASRINGFDIHIAYRSRRKVISILRLIILLIRIHPAVTYVFDISYSGIAAAVFYKLIFRNPLIVETGDAITELVRSTGSRGHVGLWLTHLLESLSIHIADQMVVRGSFHKELLARDGVKAEVIQDGVDLARFTPADEVDLREKYGFENAITIGLVGTSIWSEKLQNCYGWELVEVVRLLKDKPVRGIMIGDGSGITHLKSRCREYGIEDRVVFLGRLPYEDLPRYLPLIDICLSTQTNDVVGKVRTTGKLPLYLASGRYILATNVGEAARVLPKEMLIDFDGSADLIYPHKLKARIEEILDDPKILARGKTNIALTNEKFDYSVLAEKMRGVIQNALQTEA